MRKIQIGILVLIMCFVVAISGCTMPTNNTSTSKSSSNNSTANNSASGDVSIVIQYSGSWACDASGNFGYRSLAGTGDQTISMGAITGVLTAAARKTEGGSGTLIVSIKKGGNTLASQSTNAPYGGVTAVATGI
ncbi:MAG: hypothetical protein LUQ24_05645 [Methanobacterium sp.]|nr:hypothetical protein [Methanobacterium sp.]